MTRYLNPGTWKILRALVRETRLTGRALRQFDYGRRSKDGTFLDQLIASGLLRDVETLPDDTPTGHKPRPVQFRTVYELTELGKTAAEFGEFQVPDRKPETVPEKPKKTPRQRK